MAMARVAWAARRTLRKGGAYEAGETSMKKRRDGPDGEIGDASALLRHSAKLAEGMAQAVVRVIVDLRQGRFGDLEKMADIQDKLEIALARAIEIERRIDDWTRERGADGGDEIDIDLDAARDRIGGRLDRLRACCQEG